MAGTKEFMNKIGKNTRFVTGSEAARAGARKTNAIKAAKRQAMRESAEIAQRVKDQVG